MLSSPISTNSPSITSSPYSPLSPGSIIDTETTTDPQQTIPPLLRVCALDSTEICAKPTSGNGKLMTFGGVCELSKFNVGAAIRN